MMNGILDYTLSSEDSGISLGWQSSELEGAWVPEEGRGLLPVFECLFQTSFIEERKSPLCTFASNHYSLGFLASSSKSNPNVSISNLFMGLTQ